MMGYEWSKGKVLTNEKRAVMQIMAEVRSKRSSE